MPRIKNDTDLLLADLTSRLTRLVDTARKEGRADALAEVRSLVGDTSALRTSAPARKARTSSTPRKAATKRTKSGKPRKNAWAGLTPEQRLTRVNAIRVGRGLEPKKSL